MPRRQRRCDTYSHLWPDSDDRTRTAVDSVLSADSVRTKEVADDIIPSQGDMADESVGKPDSVSIVAGRGDHPSATAVTSGLVRSTRRLGRAALKRLRRRADASF